MKRWHYNWDLKESVSHEPGEFETRPMTQVVGKRNKLGSYWDSRPKTWEREKASALWSELNASISQHINTLSEED